MISTTFQVPLFWVDSSDCACALKEEGVGRVRADERVVSRDRYKRSGGLSTVVEEGSSLLGGRGELSKFPGDNDGT